MCNIALDNLASSMKRSELTRAQLMQHRAGSVTYSNTTNAPPPPPQQSSPLSLNISNFSRLADLLSGKRTALTAGVEYSRNQLRMYMEAINTNQPF